ncbi:hypothetical protein [Clostridium sp. OS1-26]|uniref:hypothetical protein n=1 Tax=Clostridium sp. OS1-26 TaxID=3070681 RepID=UPI0027E11145|nr:hypothetical protein [Clostridium sp. OS1-26]WML37463.1 hypothetical protein RCG18_13105 [Clostridium sp. OS1-26]
MKNSNEAKTTSQYTLVTSIIGAVLVYLLILILNLLKSQSFGVVTEIFPKSEVLINLILLTLIVYIIISLIQVVVFIWQYALNIYDEKKFGDSLVSYSFLTTLQVIFSSLVVTVVMAIASIVGDFTDLPLFVPAIICGLIAFGFYYLKKRFSFLSKSALFLLVTGTVFMFLINIGYSKLMDMPRLVLPKDKYSFSENIALCELDGKYSKISKANILNLQKDYQPIDVVVYKTDNKTYLKIDLTSHFMVEGEYNLMVTVDNKNIMKKFVYVYDGGKNELPLYVSRYIEQIRSELKSKIGDNPIVEEELSMLTNAYINNDKKQVDKCNLELKKIIKDRTNRILDYMYNDPIIGFKK